MRSKRFLGNIGNTINGFKYNNTDNQDMLWKDYIRIRVSINIQNSLNQSIKLGCQVEDVGRSHSSMKELELFVSFVVDWSYRQVLPQTKSSSGN